MTDLGTALRDYLDSVSDPISAEELRNHPPVGYRDEPSSSRGRWWLAVAAVFLLVVGAVAVIGSRPEETAPADVIEDPQDFIRRAIDATIATGRVTIDFEDRRVADGICTVWNPGSMSIDEVADRYAAHNVTPQGEFTAYHERDRVIVPSSAVPQEWDASSGWVELDFDRHAEAIEVLRTWHYSWISPDADPPVGEFIEELFYGDVVSMHRVEDEVTDATRYIMTLDWESASGIANTEVGDDELADSTPLGAVSADTPDDRASLWLDSQGRIVRLSYDIAPTESGDSVEPFFVYTFSGFGEEVRLPTGDEVVDFDTLGVIDPQAGVTFPESQPVLRPC